MKANKAEEQALVSLLNRIYGDIRAIEEQWNIRGEANDFRPRIEYFHDAVRALTSGEMRGDERYGRLSVEFLAYDISMLRVIQANPIVRPKGSQVQLSPSTALTIRADAGGNARANASIKAELAELYKNYSVLFVALLADKAEHNYQTRVNENNMAVENLAAVEQDIKNETRQKDIEVDLAAIAEHYIDDPELLRKLLAAAKKKRLRASEALRVCKEAMQAADKDIKAIEKAHFTYATSQLAVYENSRDVVKKMAMQGMNIVGNFVEKAVREATRGGRGF